MAFSNQEQNARNQVAELLKDPSIHHNDKAVKDLKDEIAFCGPEREKCLVFKHEFKRNPDREYHLTLGDVVFFGIV